MKLGGAGPINSCPPGRSGQLCLCLQNGLTDFTHCLLPDWVYRLNLFVCSQTIELIHIEHVFSEFRNTIVSESIQFKLNKIGLLLCHSHIELRLWLRLS